MVNTIIMRGDNVTPRQRIRAKCIEKYPELEAIEISGGEFTEAQVLQIQECVDRNEARENEIVLPIVGVAVVVMVLLLIWAIRA